MTTHHKLQALELMLSAIRDLAPLIPKVRRTNRDLADQLTRAAQSTALNLGEATGYDDGHRNARLRTALGSAREAIVCLDVATAWGQLTTTDTDIPRAKLVRVTQMTWKLLR